MCIPNQNYVIDALNTVLAWDLPVESLTIALVNQTMLLSGFDTEDSWQDFDKSSH